MEKTLSITANQARGLFPTATGYFKELMEQTFGKEFFTLSIMDRVKTWEDAAEIKGIDPIRSLPFITPKNSFEEAANAFFKLDNIAGVLLEGVVLDWANDQQKKWYAWFNNYQSGSGFSFDDTNCGWTNTLAGGGARLCLDTQEKAKYFGTQFLSLFNQFLNPIK